MNKAIHWAGATSTRSHQKLAILGGEPAFSEPLHVGRPNIPVEAVFLERLHRVLENRWLTNDGPMLREFERRIVTFTGTKYCVAMCNATIALEIAVRAAELCGEVIVPSFTFIASAHALQWQQITPVFCDIDPETHTLDARAVERMITPRTTGILATHVWGRAADVRALQEIAERRGLTLIFDAAHAFGCSYRGEMIGQFGTAEVFSFHATKFINSFEGGAVVTNDEVLARKMRLMRNFGFGGVDRVDYIGTNGKMTEVCAAMGLASLDSMPEFLAVNRRNHETYANELAEASGLKLLRYDDSECNNYQYVVVEVDESETGLTRDELVAALTAENVLARRYFHPGCHRMEPYRSLFPHAGLMLPVTEQLSERVLVLPTGTAVSAEAVRTICAVLRTAIAAAPEIRTSIARRATVSAI
jgi:dTDP-4-amino-4,6-dideoxygalactose transaminase